MAIRISLDDSDVVKVTHVYQKDGAKIETIPDEYFTLQELLDENEVFLYFKNPLVETLNALD